MTAADERRRSAPTARELVRGGVDVHVHIAPDVVERSIDDVGLARRCEEVGLAGFVTEVALHLDRRAGVGRPRSRARHRRPRRARAQPRGRGHEPAGGRDRGARGRADHLDADRRLARTRAPRPQPPGANLPVWAKLQAELRGQGIEIEPVPTLDATAGSARDARRPRRVAEHGLVLATGHLGRDEMFAIVDAARRGGHRDDGGHPPRLPRAGLRGRRAGASWPTAARWVERCFTTPYTGKCSWEHWLDGDAQRSGPERTILSTDLGQVINPPVEDGLAADGRPAARRRLRGG